MSSENEKKSTKLLVAEGLEALAAESERLRTLLVDSEDRAARRHQELVTLLVDMSAGLTDLRKDLVTHRSDTEKQFRLRPVISNGHGGHGNGASRG